MSSNILNRIRKNRLEKSKLSKEGIKIHIEENKQIPVVKKADSKDVLIERLAEEELLREAQRGAIRAEVAGPTGWLKCPLLKANKRFLTNTLRTAVKHNSHKSRSHLSSHGGKKMDDDDKHVQDSRASSKDSLNEQRPSSHTSNNHEHKKTVKK